jgi:hypothetical protein
VPFPWTSRCPVDCRPFPEASVTERYLAASSFLRPLFTCEAKNTANSLNLFEFCDPALDAKMAHAAAVQGMDPERATELWSAVDHDLVDQAVGFRGRRRGRGFSHRTAWATTRVTHSGERSWTSCG